MKLPGALQTAVRFSHLNLAIYSAVLATCMLSQHQIMDAFGYFVYVILGFAVLFLGLEICVTRMLVQIRQLGI